MKNGITMADVQQTLINLAALVTAIGALVTAIKTRTIQKERIRKGDAVEARVASLENGGGDAKVDNRLAYHGVLERREEDGVRVVAKR